MEVINYLKKSAEQLEEIIVNDITTTKKLKQFTEIEKFMNKLKEINIYINDLLIAPEIKNYNFKEIESKSTISNNSELNTNNSTISDDETESNISEDEKPTTLKEIEKFETNENDKFYLSAKNRCPKSNEKSWLYEASILRKNNKTHEEFKEKQEPEKKRLEELKEKYSSNLKSITTTKAEEKDLRVFMENGKYYKVIGKKLMKGNREQIVAKAFDKVKIGYISHDYPYNQTYTEYYKYTENLTNPDEYFERIQTRGKNKGNEIEYCYEKTNRIMYVKEKDHDSFY